MNDKELSEFLPIKGDSYALRDFVSKGENRTETKKARVMDGLRQKLGNNNNTSEEEHATKKKQRKPKCSETMPQRRSRLVPL